MKEKSFGLLAVLTLVATTCYADSYAEISEEFESEFAAYCDQPDFKDFNEKTIAMECSSTMEAPAAKIIDTDFKASSLIAEESVAVENKDPTEPSNRLQPNNDDSLIETDLR